MIFHGAGSYVDVADSKDTPNTQHTTTQHNTTRTTHHTQHTQHTHNEQVGALVKAAGYYVDVADSKDKYQKKIRKKYEEQEAEHELGTPFRKEAGFFGFCRVKSFAPRGRLRLSCGRLPSSLHYAVTATLAPKGIIRSAAR